jgi:6 kDa early secretory antigenic target
MSTEQAWNFAALMAAKEQIDAAGQTIGQELDDGQATLGRLSEVWGGDGSDAFKGVQTNWQGTSTTVKESLLSLSKAIGEACEQMQGAENKILGSFG